MRNGIDDSIGVITGRFVDDVGDEAVASDASNVSHFALSFLSFLNFLYFFLFFSPQVNILSSFSSSVVNCAALLVWAEAHGVIRTVISAEVGGRGEKKDI
jgi:hypothetical protein